MTIFLAGCLTVSYGFKNISLKLRLRFNASKHGNVRLVKFYVQKFSVLYITIKFCYVFITAECKFRASFFVIPK